MSGNTNIEWTGKTWNPIRARLKSDSFGSTKAVPAGKWGYHCEKISPGCKNCYAEAMNGRTLPAWGTGLDYAVPNRNVVEIYLDPVELEKPLRWKKPTKIFPCSMTDWCADFVTNEMRDKMLAVAALTPRHTYQFLTKRAAAMKQYFETIPFGGHDGAHECRQYRIVLAMCEQKRQLEIGNATPAVTTLGMMRWPLGNVHLGVSVEDQQRADERIPHLLATPAAVRWVSYEPAFGPVDFSDWLPILTIGGVEMERSLDWIVVGGESGRGARPFDISWARQTIEQCKEAEVPVFMKQLGAKPWDSASSDIDHLFEHCGHACEYCTECPSNEGQRERAEHPQLICLKDRKGGDPSEWPENLRVREMPEVKL